MSAAPHLLNLVWTVLAFFLGAMQIIASILLLRERNAAPWLMLIGSVISILGHAATRVFLMLLENRGGGGFASISSIMTTSTAISIFGSLLFMVGLLLLALYRRALAIRVAELEAILESRQPPGA